MTAVEDFSFVRGGPTYRLMERLRLIHGGSYARMALLFVLFTWVVLFFLSLWQGTLVGDSVRLPFLGDYAAHARFLVALPLLIVADAFADVRVPKVVEQFVRSGLIGSDEMSAFEAVVARLRRWRDTILPEAVILLLAAVHAYVALRNRGWIATNLSSWYAVAAPEGGRLTPAGWWLQVSISVFVFFLYRWLWRLILWAQFLWRVSKLNLQLTPIHADHTAGLAFVERGQICFQYALFAISATGAGVCANMIVYQGETLGSLRGLIAVYLVILIAVFASPMLILAPKLYEVKKKGLLDYGALVAGYTQSFDSKWVRGNAPSGETVLGSPDIQSLADISNSYQIVQHMRIIPMGRDDFLKLVASAAGPFLPLLLTVFSAEELVKQALKMLF